jgi:hypothetical protein
MEKFFELVGTFDAQIIFNDFPRLTTPGYRWAPRSFLGQSNELLTVSNDRSWEVSRAEAKVRPGGGLLVEFPGAKLNTSPIIPHLGKQFYFASEQDNIWYLIRLQPDENGEYMKWAKDAEYCVVSFEDLAENSPTSEAVLAIKKSVDEEGRITVDPVSRAKLEVPKQSDLEGLKSLAEPYLKGDAQLDGSENPFQGVLPVTGAQLDAQQKWCIM